MSNSVESIQRPSHHRRVEQPTLAGMLQGCHKSVFVLMVLSLLLSALLPRGYMLAPSSNSADTVTFTVVFCSGQHTPPQQLTLVSDKASSTQAEVDGSCPFALVGGGLLRYTDAALVAQPVVGHAQSQRYASPTLSPAAYLHPMTRAPPLYFPI